MASLVRVQEIQNLAGNTLMSVENTGSVRFYQHTVRNTPIAYYFRTATQSMTASTWTNYTIYDASGIVFDSHNFFDIPNDRFQPTIAGYYQIYCRVQISGTSLTTQGMSITKNGNRYQNKYYRSVATTSNWWVGTRVIMYLNGKDDYASFQGYGAGTSPSMLSAGFTAFLFQGT